MLALNDFLTDRLMLVITRKIDPMEKENIIGQMETTIKDLFLMVWGMDKATSKKEKLQFNIGENIKMIKSVDMVK